MLVGNAAGAVASQAARLAVRIPPTLTSQPQNFSVAPGGSATFSVSALGSGLLRYQWQFNGQNLDGATNSTLSIPNAQLGQEGDYRVLVGDDIATGPSQVARLTVRVPPVILVPPRGQTNVVGSTLTFSVVASGSVRFPNLGPCSPFGWRWRLYKLSPTAT